MIGYLNWHFSRGGEIVMEKMGLIEPQLKPPPQGKITFEEFLVPKSKHSWILAKR
jgi:hypothetical protein